MCEEKIKTVSAPTGSGIYISAYDGNYERFIVPQTAGGGTVCGIMPFAFSEHRELRELGLPETVAYIGAHAFYNCRSLKRLVLSDGASEIGDGAFKNCYALTEVDLTRRMPHTKCLKGILSEMNHAVTVTIHYGEKTAQLFFPYYLYNYEENTPARIVNQITEGAGIQYRECIGGEDIHYAEYDNLFETGVLRDVQDASWQIAVCRLRFPYRLSKVAAQRYREFLQAHRIALTNRLVAEEDDGGLKAFLSLSLLDRADLHLCIDAARSAAQMEGLGILLAYQRGKYGITRKSFEL